MPDLTYIEKDRLIDIIHNVDLRIKKFLINIQITMNNYGIDNVDKFVIDEAVTLAHKSDIELNIKQKNNNLVKSNEMKLKYFTRIVEPDNTRVKSILGMFYDNNLESIIIKDDNLRIFKDIMNIKPLEIYDIIYWNNDANTIDYDFNNRLDNKNFKILKNKDPLDYYESKDGGEYSEGKLNICNEDDQKKSVNLR